MRARLSDAKFFWDTDRKTRLEDRLGRLRAIVFHEKLGTQYERVERIAALARVISDIIEPQKRVGEMLFRGNAATYHNSVRWPPISPRPTSSPRWSASSRSCRG